MTYLSRLNGPVVRPVERLVRELICPEMNSRGHTKGSEKNGPGECNPHFGKLVEALVDSNVSQLTKPGLPVIRGTFGCRQSKNKN